MQAFLGAANLMQMCGKQAQNINKVYNFNSYMKIEFFWFSPKRLIYYSSLRYNRHNVIELVSGVRQNDSIYIYITK